MEIRGLQWCPALSSHIYHLDWACIPSSLGHLQGFLRSRSLALDGACAVIKQAQITQLADVNSAPSCNS